MSTGEPAGGSQVAATGSSPFGAVWQQKHELWKIVSMICLAVYACFAHWAGPRKTPQLPPAQFLLADLSARKS